MKKRKSNLIVYKTTNLINDKIYVGQHSKGDPTYLGSGYILKKALEKYGVENFTREVLEYCNSQEELDEKEKYWIKKLKSQDDGIGYNITPGGRWGDTFTHNPNKEERRNKGIGIKQSLETIQKRVSKIIGRKNTIESNKRISDANKGKYDTPSLKVYKYDFEFNLLEEYHSILYATTVTGVGYTSIRSCAMGENRRTAGGYLWSFKILDDDDILLYKKRLEIRKGSKQIGKFDENDNLIEKFDSIKQASKITGIHSVCICSVCRGRQKTAGGFIWKHL